MQKRVHLSIVRARLLFALVRASSLCLRGARVKWRSGLLDFDGGALFTSSNHAIDSYLVFLSILFVLCIYYNICLETH